MASLWLARASSQLARRAAARRPPPRPARHGSGQPTSSWFLGSVPQAALGSPALDTSRRGFCSVRRFAGESSAAAAAAAVVDEEPESGFAAGDQQAVDFPGGKVSFVAEMNFLPESTRERINCYRVLDDDGRTISGSRFQESGAGSEDVQRDGDAPDHGYHLLRGSEAGQDLVLPHFQRRGSDQHSLCCCAQYG
uniref:Uncharacterized protein n=1 Tax=Zea mays TaxID=4577 RepID=B4FU76_MAIZE|nr:unknown [Zea mays]